MKTRVPVNKNELNIVHWFPMILFQVWAFSNPFLPSRSTVNISMYMEPLYNCSQSSKVLIISCLFVITNGPYWNTVWSRGSPAMTTISVPFSMVLIATPVWPFSPDKTRVWKASWIVFNSEPMDIDPFRTRRRSVVTLAMAKETCHRRMQSIQMLWSVC